MSSTRYITVRIRRPDGSFYLKKVPTFVIPQEAQG